MKRAILNVERPLEGQTVLITRPGQPTGDRLGLCLAPTGATVVSSPVIQILPPPCWDDVDRALDSIDNYNGCVFLSHHGVQAVLNRAKSLGNPGWSEPPGQFFSIGSGTQAELERLTGKTSLVPKQSNSLSMAELLLEHRHDSPFLVFRGNRGSSVLPDQLSSNGIPFEQVIAYGSADVELADPLIVQRMNAGQIDWVTVTSSAIARALVKLFGDSLNRTRLASISPTTSGVLTDLGYRPVVESRQYDFDGLVKAMIQWVGDQSDLPNR